MKKTDANTRLALMGMLTVFLSVGLMNVGRLEDCVPDWCIRAIGIVTMLCTVLSIFFTVRQLAEVSRKKNENNSDDSEKE